MMFKTWHTQKKFVSDEGAANVDCMYVLPPKKGKKEKAKLVCLSH
jgi:hypothetical protein